MSEIPADIMDAARSAIKGVAWEAWVPEMSSLSSIDDPQEHVFRCIAEAVATERRRCADIVSRHNPQDIDSILSEISPFQVTPHSS